MPRRKEIKVVAGRNITKKGVTAALDELQAFTGAKSHQEALRIALELAKRDKK